MPPSFSEYKKKQSRVKTTYLNGCLTIHKHPDGHFHCFCNKKPDGHRFTHSDALRRHAKKATFVPQTPSDSSLPLPEGDASSSPQKKQLKVKTAQNTPSLGPSTSSLDPSTSSLGPSTPSLGFSLGPSSPSLGPCSPSLGPSTLGPSTPSLDPSTSFLSPSTPSLGPSLGPSSPSLGSSSSQDPEPAQMSKWTEKAILKLTNESIVYGDQVFCYSLELYKVFLILLSDLTPSLYAKSWTGSSQLTQSHPLHSSSCHFDSFLRRTSPGVTQ